MLCLRELNRIVAGPSRRVRRQAGGDRRPRKVRHVVRSACAGRVQFALRSAEEPVAVNKDYKTDARSAAARPATAVDREKTSRFLRHLVEAADLPLSCRRGPLAAWKTRPDAWTPRQYKSPLHDHAVSWALAGVVDRTLHNVPRGSVKPS